MLVFPHAIGNSLHIQTVKNSLLVSIRCCDFREADIFVGTFCRFSSDGLVHSQHRRAEVLRRCGAGMPRIILFTQQRRNFGGRLAEHLVRIERKPVKSIFQLLGQ